MVGAALWNPRSHWFSRILFPLWFPLENAQTSLELFYLRGKSCCQFLWIWFISVAFQSISWLLYVMLGPKPAVFPRITDFRGKVGPYLGTDCSRRNFTDPEANRKSRNADKNTSTLMRNIWSRFGWTFFLVSLILIFSRKRVVSEDKEDSTSSYSLDFLSIIS